MSVTLVNCFEVPAGRDDEFFALWRQVNAYMASKPGYLGHHMHRSLSTTAHFRYVNVATWETAEQWKAGHDDGFRALMNDPGWKSFKPTFALYELVHEGTVPA